MHKSLIEAQWHDKALFRLIAPIVVEQLLTVAIGAVDMMMVGIIGEHAVSGVDIVNNISNLFIIAFGALSTGGAVVTSQYIGRNDRENACGSARQLVHLVMAVASLTMILTVICRDTLIRTLYGTLAPDVMEAAVLYLLVTALSYPFLAVGNASAAIFRAAGNSRTSMLVTLLANMLNVAGNAVLIFALHLGVLGAALSTLISRIVTSVALLTLLITRGSGPVSLAGIHRTRPRLVMIRQIVRIAAPGGLESSIYSFGKLLTQRIFPAFGVGAIAANAVANTTDLFAVMPGVAFGMSLVTVVGQCVGARDYEGAKRLTAKIMRWTYLTLTIISGATLLFSGPLVGLFHLSRESGEMARVFIAIGCFTEAVAFSAAFTLPGALRAAGDVRFTLFAPTISMWILRIGGSYLLVYGFHTGPVGVWFAMCADNLCRGLCNYLRWRSGRWQTKRVLDDDLPVL
jgi:putative MATE family efflux protein